MKVFVPCDAASVACGADEVATAIAREAKKAKRDVEIVRNGSRGVFAIEPLVEVETKDGRIGYGPRRRNPMSRGSSPPACSTAGRMRSASASPKTCLS